MKIERTKNASRNIVFGLGLKIYQIVVPFLMRSAMLYFMGVEYLGLNSLFTSILQVLNLAELGVGAAMVYSMYKPIAEDDNDTLCALLLLYKKYYAIIGGVIAFCGICFTPFLPKLIKGNIPDSINIYILYLLNLGATVLSYWLYAYKNSVLQAHQRNDVVSKVNICTDTVKYIIQILVLWLFKNYYLYVITILATQTLSNIVTAYFANKIFPKVVPRGNLEKEKIKAIQKRIRDLFTSKLGAVIVNSADTVVISAFLGLKVLAIYQNYFFIISSIIGLLDVIFVSCMAGIGNSLIVEDKNKNFNDLNTFLFLVVWISGIVTCCLLNVFQPFIKLWTGESLMLEYGCVICFCIYFFMYEVNRLLNMYKDAGGIWHEDRFRPLVTALCNLVINLIMVQTWGLYGVLLSTVISMLVIGEPWLIYNLFTTMFEKNRVKGFLINLFKQVFVVIISAIVCVLVCSTIKGMEIFVIIVRGLVCVVISNFIYYIVFHNSKEFSMAVALIDKVTKRKLKLIKKLKKGNSDGTGI